MRTITYALSRLRGEQAAHCRQEGHRETGCQVPGHPCPSPGTPVTSSSCPQALVRGRACRLVTTQPQPQGRSTPAAAELPPPAVSDLLTGEEGAQPEITFGDNMQQAAHCHVLGVEARVPGGLGPCTRGHRLPGIPSYRQGAEA